MSKIAWTDKTWNPIVGCSKCSAGCQNCYAEKMAVRLAGMGHMQYKYLETITQESPYEWSGKTTLTESELEKPLHWRKPRKIFVCSMGDLFHESVPFEWIDKVFAVMALCPQHTFQVLTKRADRMKEYFDSVADLEPESDRDMAIWDGWRAVYGEKLNDTSFPLPNVWLGVTAENQEMADLRIPILLQTPAAKRFVSVEPMLGAVDIIPYCGGRAYKCKCEKAWHHTENNRLSLAGDTAMCLDCGTQAEIFPTLDWVIVGAESGAGMRWCAPEWPRSLVKQCQSAAVPVFVKQLHTTMINTKFKLIKEPACWPLEFPDSNI